MLQTKITNKCNIYWHCVDQQADYEHTFKGTDINLYYWDQGGWIWTFNKIYTIFMGLYYAAPERTILCGDKITGKRRVYQQR